MTETTQTRRAPRWMKVLLALSLALNLLIIGVIAGAVSRGGSKETARLMRDVSFGPYTMALTREDRREMRRAIRSQDKAFDRAGARENFRNFLVVLQAEELDLDQLERVFDTQIALAQTRQGIGKTVLLNQIAGMSVEERRVFAERLQEEIGGRGPKKQP